MIFGKMKSMKNLISLPFCNVIRHQHLILNLPTSLPTHPTITSIHRMKIQGLFVRMLYLEIKSKEKLQMKKQHKKHFSLLCRKLKAEERKIRQYVVQIIYQLFAPGVNVNTIQ